MGATNHTKYKILQSGADEPEIVSESAYNKLVEAATKANTPAPEVQAAQTFAFYEAATLDEIATLVPNEDVRLSYFNRGLTLREFAAMNRIMEDDKFEPVEGVYDLAEVINTIQERTRMTPEEKALRDLKNLPDDVRQRVLAALLGQAEATA